LEAGLPPDALIKALDLSPCDSDLHKYNPNQLRVPAGSGRPSGQWTTGGGGAPTAQALSGTTPRNRLAPRKPSANRVAPPKRTVAVGSASHLPPSLSAAKPL